MDQQPDDPWAGFTTVAPAPTAQPSPTPSSDPWAGFIDANAPPKPKPAPTPQAEPSGGILSNATNESDLAGHAKNIATGAIKGATSSVTGAGLEGLADYAVAGVEHLFTGRPVDEILSRIAQQKAAEQQYQAQHYGFSVPNPSQLSAGMQGAIFNRIGEYQPTSELGRLEQAAAAGVAGSVGPGVGMPAVGKPAISFVKSLAAQAPANAAAAATAQGVGDVTGNPYLGMATAVGVPAVTGLASRLKPMQPIMAGLPKGSATAEALAGEKLLQAAKDPAALKANAQAGLTQPSDTIVEGSKPTLFQVTGDQGIGQAEREVRTAAPADFLTRANEQNAARVASLQGLRPEGTSQDLADFVTDRFRQLDERSQAYLDQATQEARDKAGALAPGLTPEQHGAALRNAVAEPLAAAKANENALHEMIDPDGTLRPSIMGLKAANLDAYGNLGDAARASLSPAEQTYSGLVNNYSNVIPYREFADFKSGLAEAMRQELSTNGRTQAYRRMSQLMKGVYDTINDTVAGRVNEDNAAVAAGVLAPEDAISAMIAKQAAERDAWYAARSQQAAGASNLASAGANGPSGSSIVPGTYRTQSQSRSGPANPAGDQGIQGNVPPANFPPEAQQRLAAATEATKNRASTYNEGIVGDILAPGKTSGTYQLQDSAVPRKVFTPGDTGGQTMDAYLKASGPEGIPALQGHVADLLAGEAVKDGVVDPAALENLKKRYAQALSRLPPELMQSFDDAGSATTTMGNVAAARKQAMDTYQKSALGKLIGADDPDTVDRVVSGLLGSKDKAVKNFRLLAAEAARDKTGAATIGLKRAVLDHIDKNFIKDTAIGNAEAQRIKANGFQTFVRKNDAILSQVFSPEEMQKLRAMSLDISRSNQSIENKVPGPGTAQDILPHLKAAAAKSGHGSSLLASLVLAREAIEPILHHFGHYGAIAGGATLPAFLGYRTISAMRNAGFRRVAELYKEGILNPEVGRALIMRASERADQGSQSILMRALQRLSLVGNVYGNNKNNKQTVH